MINPLDRGAQWADVINTLAQLPVPEVLECQKEVVYQQDKIKLYRYTPLRSKLKRTPLLITFALVNRPYILDLQPDRSLVRVLLESGIDVYLIDWGYPTRDDHALSLDDYILRYLDQCVDFIRTVSEKKSIDLLGVCQGGTMSLCYTALFPKKIRKLVTMITAVDFHTKDNTLTALIQDLDVDGLTQQWGNMPGCLLNQTFFSLKPLAGHWLKYQRALKEHPHSEKMAHFLRMERWLFDTPDQTGAAFTQYVKQFYQQNLLVRKQFFLGDQIVDLSKITHPVLNIFAAKDEIVPPSASKCLKKYIRSRDYQQLIFAGGHIGIYASRKAQEQIPPQIAQWL
jgi:polyhydroxyalkanoate synthase